MNAARVVDRAGFTLIEVLVTLILLSLLVAAVFPMVTRQIGQADAPRMANDLVSIRSGIETFSANMRRGFPGDLEDLIFVPDYNVDQDVTGASFLSNQTQIDARWNGPYADFTATEGGVQTDAELFETGFGAFVGYDLTCFRPASAASGDAGTGCESGDFVAVKVTDMSVNDFIKVNELFDGVAESQSSAVAQENGKLRCAVSGTECSTVYYLAVPFRN